MALAEQKTSPQASPEQVPQTWHGIVQQTLKRNEIRLVPYVPDRVLTTLIKSLHADPFFTTFPTAREEEAVGIVSGAWMGGAKGAVLMQTSGFATLANVLASLAMPYQIPLIMFVSERGTLGEFNYGQALVCRTTRGQRRRHSGSNPEPPAHHSSQTPILRPFMTRPRGLPQVRWRRPQCAWAMLTNPPVASSCGAAENQGDLDG